MSNSSITHRQLPTYSSHAADLGGNSELLVHCGDEAIHRATELQQETDLTSHPTADLRWLQVLRDGLQQVPYLIEFQQHGQTLGWLPLSFVSSLLFGKFLVGLPYLNSGGVDRLPADISRPLIDEAIALSQTLNCRYLELRHERSVDHPDFNAELSQKVHMRLALPETEEMLWDQLKSKVRSQVRKGLQNDFQIAWGGGDLLAEFYDLFAIRMHQLGTPVYGRKLFDAILNIFGTDAEICCVRDQRRTIAAGIIVHGSQVTEVPSASSLIEYNSSNANMVLYWNMLTRAISRNSTTFDFGRATTGSGTHRFKKQWGAEESSTCWQYHVRHGSAEELRPDHQKNQRKVELWKKLPCWVTRLCGPRIVRGIP